MALAYLRNIPSMPLSSLWRNSLADWEEDSSSWQWGGSPFQSLPSGVERGEVASGPMVPAPTSQAESLLARLPITFWKGGSEEGVAGEIIPSD